jgi:hypothetical protein
VQHCDAQTVQVAWDGVRQLHAVSPCQGTGRVVNIGTVNSTSTLFIAMLWEFADGNPACDLLLFL